MKSIIYLLSILLFNNYSFCQIKSALIKYKVESPFIVDNDGIKQKIATLDYDGYLYIKGDKSIYFKKPLYLQKYPLGYIKVVKDAYNASNFDLFMDTMQGICYRSSDSLVDRSRMDVTGLYGDGVNTFSNFKIGAQHWQLLSETKIINGLPCQKATRTSKSGVVFVTIWFTTEVNILAGPNGMYDLPGMVVEAEYSNGEKILLDSYNLTEKINDAVFWPNLFNQSFIVTDEKYYERLRKLSEASKN